MKKILQSIDFRDMLAVSGVSSACYGTWLVFPPAAYMLFGVICLFIWWIGRR